jgi:hypothetical protein
MAGSTSPRGPTNRSAVEGGTRGAIGSQTSPTPTSEDAEARETIGYTWCEVRDIVPPNQVNRKLT